MQSSDLLTDIVIGMSDGLTVPFALAAGLSGAVEGHVNLIWIAGIAEVAAGSIAMGLGGYLAGKTEQDHYKSELKKEYWELEHKRDVEIQEVRDVFLGWGLSKDTAEEATQEIIKDKKRWVEFMYEWQPNFIKDSIEVVGPYVFIGKALEQGEFGPIFSIALDSMTAALPSIATGIMNITPTVVGFLPIPEAGPIGAVIGWMLASVFILLLVLLHITREHFGQAFVVSFLLIPFVGTTLYNGALSGEKFVTKLNDKRKTLIDSIATRFGEESGIVAEAVIPDLTYTGESDKRINIDIRKTPLKVIPEGLRSLADMIEGPKKEGGKRLSRHKHKKSKWRTQRKLRE
jgi:VIT1/CCC1 family predicted Fe2+/Mn2+ transporter